LTLASVVAATATSAGMLIAARAILGVAGATLAPSTLSLIRNLFLDERQRTVAIGYWVRSPPWRSAPGWCWARCSSVASGSWPTRSSTSTCFGLQPSMPPW
jgi:MFS family permease